MFFKIRAVHDGGYRDPDWSQCKIYRIQSLPGIKPYIGYTTQSLGSRMNDHEYAYTKGRDDGTMVHIVTGVAQVDELEKYPCYSRDEAKARVGEYKRALT